MGTEAHMVTLTIPKHTSHWLIPETLPPPLVEISSVSQTLPAQPSLCRSSPHPTPSHLTAPPQITAEVQGEVQVLPTSSSAPLAQTPALGTCPSETLPPWPPPPFLS